ncbi:MAG TPA: ABC transporter ATP-binding protein [Anaerolineales bacterium]|nr:ABC transporter ATP-binding protein [Anaerolineales bacterium]
MSVIIEIVKLTKRYGKKLAVNDLSLQVETGAIYGFVGPNGAGKTSTMRILCTLMHPTTGTIRVGGYDVLKNPRDVRRLVGYMPDFFGVYDDMTVMEYLDFFAACYDLPAQQRASINTDLLALVDLSHRANDMVDNLSRGMKQRLALARTLAHDPQVLVLDEPASGLDPRARVEIRELLVELARMGKTIFFSTHILADVAEICTHVGILEGGKLVASGNLNEMQRQLMPQRTLSIKLIGSLEQAQAVLGNIPGVLSVIPYEGGTTEPDSVHLRVAFGGTDTDVSDILQALVMAKLRVLHFTEDMRDVESIFLQATQGKVT